MPDDAPADVAYLRPTQPAVPVERIALIADAPLTGSSARVTLDTIGERWLVSELIADAEGSGDVQTPLDRRKNSGCGAEGPDVGAS